MWKKLVSLNLALLLLLALLPVPASAASNFFYSDGSYNLFALAHWNSGLEGDTLFFPKACFLSSGPDLMLYETASTFKRDGYAVTSYNSKADGSGWSYPLTLKAKYSFSRKRNDPAHLYAQWTKVTGLFLLYVGDGVGTLADGRDYELQDGLQPGDTVQLAEADLFPSEGSRKIIGWREVGEPYREFLPGQSITLDSSMTLTPILGTNYITYHYGGTSETVFYETPYASDSSGGVSWRDIAHDPVGSSEIVQRVYESCKEKNQFFTGWEAADGQQYRGYVKDAPHDLYAVTGNFPDTDYCVLYSEFGFPDGSLYQSCALDSDGTAPALPASPEAPEGYQGNFIGWRDTNDFFADDATEVDDTTLLESGAVVYACWGGYYDPPDSETFTVAFDPLNGSGIQYVRSQYIPSSSNARKVIPPGDPVKEGYTFLGWSWYNSGDIKVDFDKAYIDEDKTFYACWERNNEAIPGNNDPPEGSSLITFWRSYCCAYTGADGVLADAAWPPDPILRGDDYASYTFQGWCVWTPYIPGGPPRVQVPVSRGCVFSGDTDVDAMWLRTGQDPDLPGPDNPWHSTVKFILNYPDAPAPPPDQTTDDYGRLTSLPVPAARSGYTFQGWFTDQDGGIKAAASTAFPENTTLYAHWTPDGTTPPGPGDQFTVTFDTQGGSAVASQTVASGGKLTQPANPTRTGYTFGGWFKEAACTNAWNFGTDTVIGNVTLYAKWTPDGTTQEYTVTFDTQGGSAVASQTVASGGKATQPANPTRTGYTFGGWYKEAACTNDWKFDTDTVSGNTTLYAKWTPNGTTPPGPGDQFTVTFDSQGGSAVAAQTVANGGKVTQPANPTRTSYTFGGWYKEAACTNAWNFGTDTVSGNTTLYAKWTPGSDRPGTYTVTFDPNGGTGGGPLTTGTDGRLEALPGIPVRAGYVFEGWYTAVSGGTQVTTATVFTQNVTVYARWRSQTAPTVRHRIYTPYRTPGGSLYVSHTYAAEGTRVTIEVDPRTNFELDWISVTNLDTGRELRLTSRYGDEYTFTMPDGDVEVDAAFTGRSSGGSSSGYVPADPPRQQASVKPVRWYYRNGSIYHVTDGLVPAAGPLTRDMLVSVLYNMDETSSGDQELWATGSAILPNIYDSGLWGTDMALSREQAAMILFQYARYKGYNISQRTGIEGYYDYAQVRPVARIAVSWARAAGLINGTSANALSPKSQLSCGEANVILSRFTANVA